MSLDFSLQQTQPVDIFTKNYTHNVTPMWEKAGVYEALYNSDGKKASEIIYELCNGYADMFTFPEKYESLNPENGWGSYDSALIFLKEVLQNCIDNPNSIINISK